MDDYKVKILTKILEAMKQDEYYICRVKGDGGFKYEILYHLQN